MQEDFCLKVFEIDVRSANSFTLAREIGAKFVPENALDDGLGRVPLRHTRGSVWSSQGR